MTFLTPIAGIVAACIAAPLLLLLYFLKLKRRPVRVSSTLLWERAVRDLQVNAPFRWLRWSFLLLLQLLALAAFCMALARPAIDAQSPPAARQILLIDASASMNALDGAGDDQSRLDQAKETALELIDRLDEGVVGSQRPEAAIVSFAGAPSVLASFTSSKTELQRAVQRIEPTDQPANLASALKLAEALVMQGRADDVATRVLLIGDGAYSDVGAVALGPTGLGFIRVGPPPGADIRNLGITSIAARRDLDDASSVRMFARVLNASREPANTALTLRLDDEAIESRDLVIPGADDDRPGEAAVTFELRDTPRGEAKLATVTITQRDVLASDNSAALRLDPALPPRVLIVSPPVMTQAQELVQELLVGAIRAIGATIVDTIDAGAFNRLESTPDAVNRYDLIIFDSASVAWVPPVPSISFGGAIPIEGVRVRPAQDGSPTPFTSWRRSHPLLRQVNLDAVTIARASRLVAVRDSDETAAATELAFGNDGPLLILAQDNGTPRLLAAFELAQTNWPVQVSFVVFLTNAIEQLTRLIGETTGVHYTTTDPIAVPVAPGAETVTVTGPKDITLRVPPDASTVSLGALELAGVYRASDGAGEAQFIPVSVLSDRESAAATRDQVRVAGETAQAGTIGEGAPLEIWKWFVLAGLAILTIEWLLYAWRMRV